MKNKISKIILSTLSSCSIFYASDGTSFDFSHPPRCNPIGTTDGTSGSSSNTQLTEVLQIVKHNTHELEYIILKKTKVKAEAEYQKNVSEGARVLMEKLEALYDSVDWRFSENTKRKIQECNNDLDAYYTKNAQFNKLHDLELYSKIIEDEKALDDYQMRRIGIVDTHETDIIVNQRTYLSLNNIISAIKSYNSDNPKIIALKNSLTDHEISDRKKIRDFVTNNDFNFNDPSLPDDIKNCIEKYLDYRLFDVAVVPILAHLVYAIQNDSSDNPKIIALKNSLRDNIKRTPKYIVNEKIERLDISDLPDDIKRLIRKYRKKIMSGFV